ncbi:Uncharacterised protein [Mycobacteroides abscessus subsp. abscessus]|nr:Uncharacterised protein [Mycobacteroides abscessus subsp. abscessus]
MDLRLFNDHKMDWRAVSLDVGPRLMKIKQFDHHVDEIFEPEAVVLIGQHVFNLGRALGSHGH